MSGFQRRFYVDHCHLRDFRNYMHPGTEEVVDTVSLERHVQHVLAYLKLARERGATDYLVFSRGFEHLLTYDELGLYQNDHPRLKMAQIFRDAVAAIFTAGVALDLGMWFHTNQFEFPDEVYAGYGSAIQGAKRVCPGKELTWRLLAMKIREFFRLLPQARGLQITASESQVSIFSCSCSACAHLSRVDRIRKLVSVAHETATACGKECQVRPRSGLEAHPDAYLEMVAGLDPGSVIATKHTRSDYYISEPFNPSVGLGHVQQAVEFDCWREWSGWNRFPCYMGDIFSDRLRRTHEQGVNIVAARLNWSPEVNELFDRPWGNTVNLMIFDRIACDIALRPDMLLQSWLAETYDTRETDRLFRLYKLSYPAHHLAFSFLGRNCGDHSGVFRPRGECSSYVQRLESVLHKETCDRMFTQPQLLTHRLQQLDEVWGNLRAALDWCRQDIPKDWFSRMQVGLENTLSCAKVNTYLMLLYVHIRGGCSVPSTLPPSTLPLAQVRERLLTETSAWQSRDARDYASMGGQYATVMLSEVISKGIAL